MAIQREDVQPVEGMEPQVGLLMAMLDATTLEWREELGDVSEEAVVWQPFPNGHSIGALILHIADVEAFWLYQVAAGKTRSQEELEELLSEATQQYAVHWPEPPHKPLNWYYAQHDAIRERTRQTAREWSDPERLSQRKNYEFTLRWLLHHVIIHEAYHGGQAVLLALMHASRTG